MVSERLVWLIPTLTSDSQTFVMLKISPKRHILALYLPKLFKDKQGKNVLLKKIYGVAKEVALGHSRKSRYFLRRTKWRTRDNIWAKNYKTINGREIVYLVIEKNVTLQICAKVCSRAKCTGFLWKLSSGTVLEMDCALEKGPCLPSFSPWIRLTPHPGLA